MNKKKRELDTYQKFNSIFFKIKIEKIKKKNAKFDEDFFLKKKLTQNLKSFHSTPQPHQPLEYATFLTFSLIHV